MGQCTVVSAVGWLWRNNVLYNLRKVKLLTFLRLCYLVMTRQHGKRGWNFMCLAQISLTSELNSCLRLYIRGLEIPATRKETNARQLALRLYFIISFIIQLWQNLGVIWINSRKGKESGGLLIFYHLPAIQWKHSFVWC